MSGLWIKDATILNEGRRMWGSVLIEGSKIARLAEGPFSSEWLEPGQAVINAHGLLLLPGVIDDQVHFRDPGFPWKATIESETRAAAAGGVTSFMDMPNTIPPTTTVEALEAKFERAARTSRINYSFFFGGTNQNWDEIARARELAKRIPGLKLFLGSSTGDLLVDDPLTLERIFREWGLLIAIHAESNEIIQRNVAYYSQKYGREALDATFHAKIRSAEACYASSSRAVELALRTGARLHLLHLSTAREMDLLDASTSLEEKRITAEVCVHHLWFKEEDYATFGNRVKWNPAIKTRADRQALREALNDNRLDIVATDHAPHLLAEKEGTCLSAASGGPLIQHSLVVMLEMVRKGYFTYEKVVSKMAHDPARLYRIDRRGFIRPGYYADLVLVDPDAAWCVSKENILYRCGWSPFEGYVFHHRVVRTFVNGQTVYANGHLNEDVRGMELRYLS